MSRMLQLQEQFRNTKKDSSSITKFCHSLKNLAEAFVDCNSKIDKVELVMQILRQLAPSYHIIFDVTTNTEPFPPFLEEKNMLLMYETSEESTDPLVDVPLTSFAYLCSSSTHGKSRNNFNKGTQGVHVKLQALYRAPTMIKNLPPKQGSLLGPNPVVVGSNQQVPPTFAAN
ncbi:unnamed protein product [Lactuca saligna]|uniref:Uncharacterized protein n=1 Tax=Lactuca saligna TaxID=75948 RepID=A0AA35YRI1_LACSI|nr:unnamed protein product [Lactuca saligna]